MVFWNKSILIVTGVIILIVILGYFGYSSLGICDRTPAIRDAIIESLPDVSWCGQVNSQHLETIQEIKISEDLTAFIDEKDIYNRPVLRLKARDFDGLINLKTLQILSHSLNPLPENIFGKLSNLKNLSFSSDSLPVGVFDKNTKLEYISLGASRLASLPVGVFDNNPNLREVHIWYSNLSSLPVGVFDNNPNLRVMSFFKNENLSSLPVGVFDNNPNLREVHIWYSDLSSLPVGVFDQNTKLEIHLS